MTDLFPAVTPHYNARKPSMIVIHGTEVDHDTSLAILNGKTEREASAHYYIDDKGTVTQFLDESVRAWHAGKSHWSGFSDVNSLSIGIELLALSANGRFNGDETVYTDAQIDALAALCKEISTRYNIPANHVLGHQDIDSGRYATEAVEKTPGEKTLVVNPLQMRWDPGPRFPWQKLAGQGVGLWHGLEQPAQDVVIEDSRLIDAFAQMLTLYGYDTRPAPVGRTMYDAVSAFQTHFLPWNICGLVTEQSIRALDILLQKKFGS